MAQSSFLRLILVLSLVLVFSSMVESAKFGIGFGNIGKTLSCTSVYAAQSGDTCDSVAKGFGLSSQHFATLNPNLNCNAIFVSQWLCIEDSA
ncbi:hypothetical protein F511_07157 [Dorcoceras hygrometricum]|nr:hypothetical protein F511_07157 [Dorcoceras hygrometricum]